MHRLSLAALLLIAPPLAAAPSSAPSGYAVTDLGQLNTTGGVGLGATAINDPGQIILSGVTTPAPQTGNAMFWDSGHETDLGTLPPLPTEEGTYSEAYGLNNRGQVVGGAGDFRAPFMGGLQSARGFLYGRGALRQITGEGTSFQPFAINDAGQIAGRDAHRGFFYERETLTNLGTLSHIPAGNASTARALSAAGLVVGWSTAGGKENGPILPFHAFRWEPKTRKMYDLGTLPGRRNSYAYGINDKGQIVGVAENEPATSFGFLGASATAKEATGVQWFGNKVVALAPLPGDTGSAAWGINSAGRIVGQSVRGTARTRAARACLWDNGKAVDLTALLPPNSGWTLEDARAINSHGQIVGRGTLDGHPHAFLLSPR